MKYLLLIYSDENTWAEDEREHCYTESIELTQKLGASGQCLGSALLYSISTATSVRFRNGKRLITDGPFAETHGQLGGDFLIDAAALSSMEERLRTGPGNVLPLPEGESVAYHLSAYFDASHTRTGNH